MAALIGVGVGSIEREQRENRESAPYEYTEAAKRNAVIACANGEPAAIADCVYDEISSAREQANSEQDLQAQQWMARWAMWLTIITALTTLISWIALRYLRDTFQQTAKGAKAAADATKAMLDANEIATRMERRARQDSSRAWHDARQAEERAFEANYIARISNERQLRAYVGVVDFNVHSVAPGCAPYFGVKYQNCGQSPATDLLCRCFLKRTGESPDEVRFSSRAPKLASQMVLMPTGDGWGDLRAKDPLSVDEWLSLRNNQTTYVFAGYIAYRDIFGVRRITMFRHFLQGASIQENGFAKLAAATRGNRVS